MAQPHKRTREEMNEHLRTEKDRLDELFKAGYSGGRNQLMDEHGFPQTVLDCYYMVFLRKYKRR